MTTATSKTTGKTTAQHPPTSTAYAAGQATELSAGQVTGHRRLLEQLGADGVRFLFGNPGSTEEGLLDELSRFSGVDYVLGLQEAAVVGIADGYAQAGGDGPGRPAVMLLHTGVGLGNAISGLYHAMRRHTPMVALVGEAGVAFDAMDAHTSADLVSMARPVTKYAARAVHPASVLRLFRRCYKVAATPPCGPVMLALPQDVLDQRNDEEVVPTVIPETRVTPDPEIVDRAARLLAGATRPVIIAGDGIATSGAVAELERFAETWGAEVWGAMASELLMSWSHPLYRGLTGHMLGETSARAVAEADAVLICGTYVFPDVFPLLTNPFRSDAAVVHIDLDASAIARNHPVSLGIVSDPKLTLLELRSAMERLLTTEQRLLVSQHSARIAGGRAAEYDERRRVDDAHRNDVPLRMSALARELHRLLPADAMVFDESLTHSSELTGWLPPQAAGSFFQTPGGTLGVGLPGAIGMKLAHPDRTVIGFTGDGGLMYTLQALWTAAHHKIAAKLIVCHNSGYRILKQNLADYRRHRGDPSPADRFPEFFDVASPRIDTVGLARSMGVSACRVSRPEDIVPGLQAMLDHDGPFLLEAVLAADVT